MAKGTLMKKTLDPDTLNFYAIRSIDGKWFHRKGYGGSGDSWVEELSKARIYNKPGAARSQISWWFTNYPSFGCPELVVFTAKLSEAIVVNEEERIKKDREKKEKAAGIVRMQRARHNLDKAQQEFKEASKRG